MIYNQHEVEVCIVVAQAEKRSETKTPTEENLNQASMKPNTRTTLCSLLLCLFICVQFQPCLGSNKRTTDEAYVTLLYGDEFLLGVRVLGKSIRNTRSNQDMVVLVSDGVLDFAKNLLLVIFSHHSIFFFFFWL